MKTAFRMIVLVLFLVLEVKAQTDYPLLWLQSGKDQNWTQKGTKKAPLLTPAVSFTEGAINYNPSVYAADWTGGIGIVLDSSFEIRNTTILTAYRTSDSLAEYGIWEALPEGESEGKGVGLTNRYLLLGGNKAPYRPSLPELAVLNTLVNARSLTRLEKTPIVFHLGHAAGSSFKGEVSDFLIFDHRLQKDEMARWQSFLAIRNGITLHEMHYINSQNDTVWHYRPEEGYNWDIGGIGKDSLFGLNQKQSLSLSGRLSIAAGTHHSSNEQNLYELQEGEYLVWGSNGFGQTFSSVDPTFTQEGHTYRFIEQLWRMETSGGAGRIPTELRYLTVDIASDSLPYALLAVSDGLKTSFHRPQHISDSTTLVFTNLYWDSSKVHTFRLAFCDSANAPIPEEETGTDTVNSISPSFSDTKIQLNIFPNPSLGDFEIRADFPESTDLLVEIFDIRGIQVMKKNYPAVRSLRQKENLSWRGVYLVVFSANGIRESCKLVIR